MTLSFCFALGCDLEVVQNCPTYRFWSKLSNNELVPHPSTASFTKTAVTLKLSLLGNERANSELGLTSKHYCIRPRFTGKLKEAVLPSQVDEYLRVTALNRACPDAFREMSFSPACCSSKSARSLNCRLNLSCFLCEQVQRFPEALRYWYTLLLHRGIYSICRLNLKLFWHLWQVQSLLMPETVQKHQAICSSALPSFLVIKSFLDV